MKKVLFILAVMSLLFVGCSKDEDSQKTITNLSGVNWYDTQVWFRDSEGGELSGYKEVGTVAVGEKCVVSTDKPILFMPKIYAVR